MNGPERKNDAADDDAPHVPGFRTWRGVYTFVLGCFAVYVALLIAFTHAYS